MLPTHWGVVLNRPEVMAFLATHDWVAGVAELQRLGVSAHAVSRARRAGTLVAVAPGVVALAHVELTLRGRARAAMLAAGHEAFVSGPTAGALLGLRAVPRATVEITIHERRRVRPPRDTRVVRTSWIDDGRDVCMLDGVRVASPVRMLFGLARRFNQHRFERAAEDAWHLGLVDPADAAAFLAAVRRSGKTGVIRFERWLERTAARERPSHSGLELDVIDAIRAVELPEPVRQHPLTLPSGEIVHFDVAWPDLRLALEPGHSWWHGGDLGQRRDEERDQACAEVGWQVHRFDEVQVAAPGLARRIAALYRARAALLTRSPGGSSETA